MAGLRGNQAYIGVAKQSAKGTVATTAQAALPFSGGTLSPTRTISQLSETDSSRQQGVSYVEQTAAEGSPEVYVRDANIHYLLNAALGSTVDAGTTNFTHTATPSAALPYMTFWKGLGGTLFEVYQDMMVSGLTISASAGQPLTAALDLVGLKSTRLAVDPMLGWTAPADKLAAGQVPTFNQATVTLSGGATALVSSFELSINNNVTLQQTDDAIPYDLVPGQLEVTLAFDLIFETLAEYNAYHYGSTVGTAQSASIYTTTADFNFVLGANNGVDFQFTSIAYEEFPVDPNPGGDPVVASVRARAQRQASGVFVTTVTKNQVATT